MVHSSFVVIVVVIVVVFGTCWDILLHIVSIRHRKDPDAKDDPFYPFDNPYRPVGFHVNNS
jgi:hypothetical protein